MRLREGDTVVSCDLAKPGAVMLFVSSSGHGKRTKLDVFHAQNRGGQGVRGHEGDRIAWRVVAAFTVTAEDEILVFSSSGNIIRMDAKEISSQGRDATGVRVARVASGETVVAVAPVLEGDSGEEHEQPDERHLSTPRRRPSRVDVRASSTVEHEAARRERARTAGDAHAVTAGQDAHSAAAARRGAPTGRAVPSRR